MKVGIFSQKNLTLKEMGFGNPSSSISNLSQIKNKIKNLIELVWKCVSSIKLEVFHIYAMEVVEGLNLEFWVVGV